MRLRDWLNKERYTVSEFAIRMDFSRSFMSCLINGRTKCRLRTARLISRFTKGQVTVEEILSEYKGDYKEIPNETLSECKEETSTQNKS